MFCKILNRLVQCLDKGGALHEGQAGFRVNRSCMDNVYTLNEIVQGRFREDKETYAFFLDVQKAYDTVARWSVVKIVGHGCIGEDVLCK